MVMEYGEKDPCEEESIELRKFPRSRRDFSKVIRGGNTHELAGLPQIAPGRLVFVEMPVDETYNN